MRRSWTALLTGFLLSGILHADPKLEKFFAQNCVKCHGPEKQKGKVRLDKPVGALFADEELLETIATVLEAGEMPPEKEPQPTAAARSEALQILEKRILAQRPDNPLKRLTRVEYTHTLHDLFGVNFDFTGLLPPDHVEHGFDKFGESRLMSPHQMLAYLKTARFVADRLLPDAKPETRTWDFNASHFHGSKNFATGGGGDYRDGDDYVLTGFRPYRSNLHFSIDPESHDQFVIPAFGVYRLEVKAHAEKSTEGEVIGINLGDGRHPTSFHNVRRIPMPHGSKGFTTELTLKAGDRLAFTFDSARVPGRSLAKAKHIRSCHAVLSYEGDRSVNREMAHRGDAGHPSESGHEARRTGRSPRLVAHSTSLVRGGPSGFCGNRGKAARFRGMACRHCP